MNKAVIYARFSCSKQREASIDDQLRICREWCERNGYTVVNEYCDYAQSGRTDNRPEFQRMVSNAGESSAVIVYMMDRFSRDPYDAPIYKKKLAGKGVKVISATEAMPDGPEAILIERIYEAMAAMESAHTSRRVRRGMEGNAMKCLCNGPVPYGYASDSKGHFIINEDQAAIVREVFARKIAGESSGSITSDLRRRGVKNRRGKLVDHIFADTVSRNEKYTGIYSWGKFRKVGGIPQIVSREDFMKAQSVKPKKSRAAEHWGEYLLAGRAICAGCGRNLVGVSGRGRGSKKYEYYKCPSSCGVKTVRADWLEETVAQSLRDMLKDHERCLELARIVERYADDTKARKAAEAAAKRKRQAEEEISRLIDAIAGGIDPALVADKVNTLQAEVEALEDQIELAKNVAAFDVEEFAQWLGRATELSKRELIDAFIHTLLVDNEHITLILNYNSKENEPSRIDIERVRRITEWCSMQDSNLRP